MPIESIDVAILGATGLVGEALLEILAESQFPVNHLYPLASERSAGKECRFAGQSLIVEDVANFDFSRVQLAFFSAGSKASEQYAPRAAAAGCVVIDNTSFYRYEDDIPLVIPEVNPEAIAGYQKRHIIANPNCATIQLLVALKPIYDAVGITRINVATYQAVSGAGSRAVSELVDQITHMLNGKSVEPEVFAHPIAFNVIPQIDRFEENGYTREEMKMIWETEKIFGDNTIKVNPTAVRVPALYGHSEAVHIETRSKITAQDARALLDKAEGVVVIDDPNDNDYPTGLSNAVGQNPVYVGRIREDISHPLGLDLWVTADNVRKGAALNAVQIGQLLLRDYF